MHQQHTDDQSEHRAWKNSRLVFLAFVAIAAYFLIMEHRAHVFGILPYLLLAACPLLHIFHHREHGHHGPRDGSDGRAGGNSTGPPDASRHPD